jgi:hypothetical protein
MRDLSRKARHRRAQRVIRILAKDLEGRGDYKRVSRALIDDPGALTEFVLTMGGDDGQRVMSLAADYYSECEEGRA